MNLGIKSTEKMTLLALDAEQLRQLYVVKLMTLTQKQRVIFDFLSSGMTIKDIAQQLGRAEITIKVNKAKIMLALNIISLQELTAIGKCSACRYIHRADEHMCVQDLMLTQ